MYITLNYLVDIYLLQGYGLNKFKKIKTVVFLKFLLTVLTFS